METFQYKAITSSGETIEGTIEAHDQKSAIKNLQALGHFPIKALPLEKNLSWEFSSLFSQKKHTSFSSKQLLAFTQNLSTLINAGLTLDHSFKNLLNSHSELKVKKIIEAIYEDIQSGETLSSAMLKHPTSFDEFYISVIKSGEASGDLGGSFYRLLKHLETTQALRSSVTSTLIYPAILIIISLLSLIFLMSFVIPRFIPLFEGSQTSLPLLSRSVFRLSELFQLYWWTLPLLFIILVIFGKLFIRRSSNNIKLHAFLLKIPIVGPLTKMHQSARFARTASTLLENGLNLIDSLKLARATIKQTIFRNEINKAIEGVQAGKRLSFAFQKSCILSELAIDLITVGEETGQLSKMLDKIANIYEKETDQQLKRLLVFLEPVLILGLGVLIALIIVSVLLAMLSLNELVL